MRIASLFLSFVLVGTTLAAEPASEPTSTSVVAGAEEATVPSTENLDTAAAEQKPLSELADDLIYSVSRTPERPFDTPRAVNIITREQIARRNGATLADILSEETGFYQTSSMPNGGTPIVRGLGGRQALLMIDGVKVNNATWRRTASSKQQLNLIDVSQVERIEIVRGVVSVLGTEALGGVINIITRKPASTDSFGGVLRMRYGSATNSLTIPAEIWSGIGDHFKFTAGGIFSSSGDIRGGEGVGNQAYTGFGERGGHATAQLLLSPEKTVSMSVQSFQQNDVHEPGDATDLITPIRMQLASIAYQDLASRPWADSMDVTAYWNKQDDGDEDFSRRRQTFDITRNTDNMVGLNVGFGKFLGRQHFLYGVDYSRETAHSTGQRLALATGQITPIDGRVLDGTQYETLGLYVNDRFTLWNRLTVSTGLRYGIFSVAGGADLPVLGKIDIGTTRRDTTGSLNLVYQLTPNLNLIASGMRGFRAPNIEDVARYENDNNELRVPQPGVGAEHVNSYEGGIKYLSNRLSGSVFYFRNDFSNLIRSGSIFINGKNFIDKNGNGKRDSGEQRLRGSVNIGQAKVTGYELDLRYSPASWLQVFGNYTRTEGVDQDQSESLSLIQPKFGTTGVRVTRNTTRAPWAELLMRYASSAEPDDDGTFDTAGYHVWTIRGGVALTKSVRATVSLENFMNERYRYIDSEDFFLPGRQVVLGFDYNF